MVVFRIQEKIHKNACANTHVLYCAFQMLLDSFLLPNSEVGET